MSFTESKTGRMVSNNPCFICETDVGKLYAVKAIVKGRLNDMRVFSNEVEILRELDHPNIVGLHETWENPETCSLVTEFCPGGDLLDFVNRAGLPLHESAVFTIGVQVMRALKYMHNRNVIHADIKLENILLPEVNSIDSIRLIDFGLSYKKVQADDFLKVASGTINYMAPEML